MAQAVVNESRLRALFVGLSTVFNEALEAAPQDFAKTCMIIPSTGRGMDYAWLTQFPKMREWVGDKQIKNLELQTYYVANKDWESTIAVNRNDIEDDQLGICEIQTKMMGRSASALYLNIANNLKSNAFVQHGIDGMPFYGTHALKDSGGVERDYTNLGTAPLMASNFTTAYASLGVGRVAIMKMCDYEGQPLGLMPDILEVPPALEATANILIKADKLGDNSPNPYQGTVDLIVNPGLTSDTAWFLHVTSMPIKPFILQLRKAPVFVSQVSMDTEAVYTRREFKYGIEARCAGAYGFWQLSYGSTGA
jgi:phage major head subunit gpT-like protein